MKNCEGLEESLRQLEYDNNYLQDENKELIKHIRVKEDEISALKDGVKALEDICADLTHRENERKKESCLKLDDLKSKLLAKEDELRLVKKRHDCEYNELAKNHGSFLTKILAEVEEMGATLYKALKSLTAKKPEHFKSKNALEFLKHLKKSVNSLADQSSELDLKMKQLKLDYEAQTKTLNKVSNEKKLLRKEVDEIRKKNEAHNKENAKIEREKETVKTELTRTKNLLQTTKFRLDEFKANARTTKRENESVLQEKLDIETALKNYGFNIKTLLENKDDPLFNIPNYLNKINLKHESFGEICKNRFCLKTITKLMLDSSLDLNSIVTMLQCSCGCYESNEAKKILFENTNFLAKLLDWLKTIIINNDEKVEMQEAQDIESKEDVSEHTILSENNDTVKKKICEDKMSPLQNMENCIDQAENTKSMSWNTKIIIHELKRVCTLLEHVTNIGEEEGFILINAFSIWLKKLFEHSCDSILM